MSQPATSSLSILVTRLSHIGDCLLTLPMVDAIKQQLPDARVCWAVESPSHKLLELHPAVDELIVVPKRWAAKPSCWLPLRQRLRQQKFDVVIDPQGITKSAALGWLSGARKRIGIRGRWGRELSPWLNNCLVTTQASHVVDRSIELLAGLDLDVDRFQRRFQLPVCSQAQARIDRWLLRGPDQADFSRDQFAVINPGGTWASKRWEMDRFGKLASELNRQHSWSSVIVWAGSEEREMAEQIHRVAGGAAVIAEETSLTELGALCHRAGFFIGSDTGPLHLATAVGTPCVGLYGTTRPEESGAWGPQHIAIQKWYQSGSCRQRRKRHQRRHAGYSSGRRFEWLSDDDLPAT